MSTETTIDGSCLSNADCVHFFVWRPWHRMALEVLVITWIRWAVGFSERLWLSLLDIEYPWIVQLEVLESRMASHDYSKLYRGALVQRITGHGLAQIYIVWVISFNMYVRLESISSVKGKERTRGQGENDNCSCWTGISRLWQLHHGLSCSTTPHLKNVQFTQLLKALEALWISVLLIAVGPCVNKLSSAKILNADFFTWDSLYLWCHLFWWTNQNFMLCYICQRETPVNLI